MFKKFLLSLSLVLTSAVAMAQNASTEVLKEGVDYAIVTPGNFNLAPETSKPTFVNFFWYGCPHCFRMKPMVEELVKKYEGKINVVNYPVAFPKWESATKMFFTLQNEKLYTKYSDEIFNQIHTRGTPIHGSKEAFLDFMASKNENVQRLDKVYDSFAITSKAIVARDLTVAYKIDSAPSFAVIMNGTTYMVNPGMTKSYEKTIKNLDIILGGGLGKVTK